MSLCSTDAERWDRTGFARRRRALTLTAAFLPALAAAALVAATAAVAKENAGARPPSRAAEPDGASKAGSSPELAGGSWSRGRRLFHDPQLGCAKCHALHHSGGAIGPDLAHLAQREYASVFRDIMHPSAEIHPDYAATTAVLKDGRKLHGVVREVDGVLRFGEQSGHTTDVRPEDVAEQRPSAESVMPENLLEGLPPDQVRDLMTYLLTAGPSMPRDDPGVPRPQPRSRAAVEAVLAGAEPPAPSPRPLRIVLVAGPKDHGPGEHDYPAWQTAWSELLAADAATTVTKAWEWPEPSEFQQADLLVFYQRGDWNARRAADVDAFLARGGGLTYIHWAVAGREDPQGFAERIGLASGEGIRYRHGPLRLRFATELKHPITRGFKRLDLIDESYWKLHGALPEERTLGWSLEDDAWQPQLWTVERGKGRVFVSIPGHYAWSFDDPLFRVLLLRGMAWAAHESVDRFNPLVWPGASIAP